MSHTRGAAATVPPPGEDRREWIRAELRKHINPETGKRYWASDVGRRAGVAESTVSLVYKGRRVYGEKAAAVREITAEILAIPVDVLFPEARDSVATCPKCGHTFALRRSDDAADDAHPAPAAKPASKRARKSAAKSAAKSTAKRAAPAKRRTAKSTAKRTAPAIVRAPGDVGRKLPGVSSAAGDESA